MKKIFLFLLLPVLLICLSPSLIRAEVPPEAENASGVDVLGGVECGKIQPPPTLCQDNFQQQNPNDNSIYGPNGILTKVTNIIAIMVGIASVIAIIIGGMRYALASGDPANVTKARNTITYALVGIAVAAAARGIVILLLDKL